MDSIIFAPSDEAKALLTEMIDDFRCCNCKELPTSNIFLPYDCEHKYCENCVNPKQMPKCLVCKETYKRRIPEQLFTELLPKLLQLREAMGIGPESGKRSSPTKSNTIELEKENSGVEDAGIFSGYLSDENGFGEDLVNMDVDPVSSAETGSKTDLAPGDAVQPRNGSGVKKHLADKSNKVVADRTEMLQPGLEAADEPKSPAHKKFARNSSKNELPDLPKDDEGLQSRAGRLSRKSAKKKNKEALKKVFGCDSQDNTDEEEESFKQAAKPPKLSPYGDSLNIETRDTGKSDKISKLARQGVIIKLDRVDKGNNAIIKENQTGKTAGGYKDNLHTTPASKSETPPPPLSQYGPSRSTSANKFFKLKSSLEESSKSVTPKTYPPKGRGAKRSLKLTPKEDEDKAESRKDPYSFETEDGDLSFRKPVRQSRNASKEARARRGSPSPSFSSECSLNTTMDSTRGRMTGVKNKRNAKGETALHIAARNGQRDKVVLLIEEGADVNAKDFGQWTPLHDAISAKKPDLFIVKKLCEAGADVNAVGDGDYTPLHDAAKGGHVQIVRYLLSQHASLAIRNSEGKLPRDLATDPEIIDAMNKHVEEHASQSEMDISVRLSLSLSKGLFYFNYDPGQEIRTKASKMLGMKIAKEITKDVTHIFFDCKPNATVQLDRAFMYGMALGAWMLSSSWVTDSIAVCRFLDPNKYEIKSCNFPTGIPSTSGIPEQIALQKARENRELKNPGLLDGMNFYLYKSTSWPSAKAMKNKALAQVAMSKKDLAQLISFASGAVVNREPNPEQVDPLEAPTRFHAGDDSKFVLTSHMILFDENNVPPVKHSMEHVKTLRIDWLVHSLIHFRLLQPECYEE